MKDGGWKMDDEGLLKGRWRMKDDLRPMDDERWTMKDY
jgi:hypothetical protein